MDDYGIAVNVARQFYSADPACSAEDLQQIAAIGIIKARKRYDPERGRFSTYAYASARNAILTHLSKTRERVFKPESEARLDDVNIEDYMSDAWSHSEKTIAKMKLSGFTISEIASELGCSTATVTNKLRKVRTRIKSQIEK